MAKALEIVYSIKERLRDYSDDSFLVDEHILFQIGTMRSTLLRQLYSDRAKGLDNTAFQTVCLQMEVSNTTKCGTVGCSVLKSKEQLPSLLSISGRSTLTRVGPPDVGNTAFELIKSSSVNSILEDPYSGTVAYIDNGYLYITSKDPGVKSIKCVSATGIFTSPEALEDFESCSSTEANACYSEDEEYPIPAHLISVIIEQVVKGYLGAKQIEPARDKDNDSVPD